MSSEVTIAGRAEITPEFIDDVVRRIVEAVNPEKVILFGSVARGEIRPESDIDLLVVMETPERRHRRAIPISRLFRPRLIPMDIIVYTPEEAARRGREKVSFYSHVLRTGKVLYERVA